MFPGVSDVEMAQDGRGQLSLGAGQLEVEAGASLEWRERLDPPPTTSP